jgi:hypothetical protein
LLYLESKLLLLFVKLGTEEYLRKELFIPEGIYDKKGALSGGFYYFI